METKWHIVLMKCFCRWYRAPELLYGARKYDEGVDIWAVGCIFGELLNHSPLFPGQNDIDQLYCVLATLGTPTSESWKVCFTFIRDVMHKYRNTV
jgi:serine/threonine protein kinase